jgi:predicted transcriptional regulator
METMAKFKLSFDINDDKLVEELDKKAKELDRPKSWIIREALKKYLGME